MKLKYCGCKDHPDRLDLSCAKIRRENGDPLSNDEIWHELHAADQAASDNADWFDALVNDLAEILGCEQKPTSIIAACKQLKEQIAATRPNIRS